MPYAIRDATIPQQEESLDLQECLISRALLFDDSPGKSEISDASTMSSSLTCRGSESSSNPEKSPEDDDISSIRSLQVGASIEEDDGEDIVEDEEETYDEEAEEDVVDEEDGEVFNNLCEGLSKMSVQEVVRLPEFTGKHTRFIYNSDDEIEGQEAEVGAGEGCFAECFGTEGASCT
ncbi:uncharacterized protein LOC103717103 [Phoenix dactylifera]|uniref:Uncharacterized protein LOC103717103 n=1 Tax=Phoenix dactylifera TaxID=42345 RepID=A0A8B7MW62_PHODC|nr:uncharacterized protein LOC103717103 [Phoenix dactylifera]XP_017700683.2 uncharacterized protein LOC103717103 [Phoenix dactylifera]XP_038982315.1 uncharacterized protein LOC103717103 [Phoenix dactylifera]XP_038982316.1 uncharacterized protein LOC103717103 [Phoenix dactylifera]